MGPGAVEQFRCVHDMGIGHSSWFPPINLYQSFYIPRQFLEKTSFRPIRSKETLTLRIHNLAICGVLNCRCGYSSRRPPRCLRPL
jgi:hypothetical protein